MSYPAQEASNPALGSLVLARWLQSVEVRLMRILRVKGAIPLCALPVTLILLVSPSLLKAQMSGPGFQPCPEQRAASYEQQHYIVAKIHLQVSNYFTSNSKMRLSVAEAQMNRVNSLPGQPDFALRSKSPFSASGAADLAVQIRGLAEGDGSASPLIYWWFINCASDSDTHQVTLLYTVSLPLEAIQHSYYPSVVHPFVSTDDVVLSEVLPTLASKLTLPDKWWKTVVPQLSYDHSRKLLLGGSMFPLVNSFDKSLAVSGLGSNVSNAVNSSYTQASILKNGPAKNLVWSTAYQRIDQPTGDIDIQHNVGSSQLILSSKDFGSEGLSYRLGCSLEGGTWQDTQSTTTPPRTERNDYVAGKISAGIDWESSATNLIASYGVEFASSFGANGGSYAKQVFDITSSSEFLPVNHRPLDLQVRATGGLLTRAEAAPTGEKFFGGNSEVNFLPGDVWQFKGQPYIRSFPSYAMAGQLGSPFGTSGFISTNVTLGFTLWYKPLVPSELSDLNDVATAIKIGLNTQAAALANVYFDRQSAAQTIRAELPSQQSDLAALVQVIQQGTISNASALTIAKFNDCKGALQSVTADIMNASTYFDNDATNASSLNSSNAKGPLSQMLKGFPPAVPADMSTLLSCLGDVVPLLRSDQTSHPELAPIGDEIEAASTKISDSSTKLGQQFDQASASASKAANSVMAYAQSVINRLFNKANLTAIGPVATMDIAKMWNGAGSGNLPLKYAPGGGINLKLFDTVNLTAVYGFNPTRKAGESTGAFGVSLSVTNWLR